MMQYAPARIPCLAATGLLIVTAAMMLGCEQTEPPPAQAAPSVRETPKHAPAQFLDVDDPQDSAEANDGAESHKVALSEPASQSNTSATTAAPGTVEVPNANVEAIDTVEVPAQEAGVIRELVVTEGDSVAEGGVMGKVDDDRAKIELQLAKIEMESSKEQAENDVNLKYAMAAEKVAELEYIKAIEANKEAPGTFTKVETEQLRLVHIRSGFQVDQAKMEMKIAGMTLSANESRVRAAENSLARRRITAPNTGVVVKLYKHIGEWVDPGDPVLRMVRSDRMRIEGYMNARDYDPHTVAGKPVTVTVELARGRKVNFDGVAKLPDLTIEADGKFRVWTEVENRKDSSAWLLRPGQRATMTIKVE
ncbi:MAG: HlyD family efflux transporter periplasmic adaptor subunit [Pirellulales bacterium]|nr:HlyD family efflux transporter periplasmic adaptor subunit [Pirellulales bacterium]